MNADEVIGKELYALKDVEGFSLADDTSTVVKTFKKGDNIGTVYSWVQKGTDVYWALDDANNKPFYVLHTTGDLSIDVPVSEGGSNPNANSPNITTTDKSPFMAFLSTYALAGGIVLSALVISYIIYKKS